MIHKITFPNDRLFPISNLNNLQRYAQFQMITDYLRINGFLQIDKISMSHSIESRNPLSDYLLLETWLRSNWNIHKVPPKSLLKLPFQSMKDLDLDQTVKLGFSPPTRNWYKEIHDFYRDQMKAPRSIEIGLIPRSWLKYYNRPFTKLGFKSPVWFQLVYLELWIRETESKVARCFTQSKPCSSTNQCS
jgi:hypothetical protein